MRVGVSVGRDRRRRRCSQRVLARPGDGRRRPRRRGHDRASRTSCRPSGEQRFTVAALDLGHQGDDAAPDGRARHRGARAAGDRRRSTTCSRSARRGVLLQRPGRPGDRRPRGRAAARRCSARGVPFFGICFGNQMLGRALGFGTYKLEVRPPRHQPAGAWTGTTGKVEVTAHNHGFAVDAPARRGDSDTPYGRVEVSHVCLNDDVVEGLRVPRRAGLLGAVPPGGGGRPARRRLPVRPVRRPDDDAAPGRVR